MSSVKFPQAFESAMREKLRDDWQDFQQAHTHTPPVSLRINTRKGFVFPGTTAIPWCASGRYLDERPVFTLDPLFHAGAYYVQEASSMFLEQALLQCGLTDQPIQALDLCAAPGGKSTHLLSLLHPESLLVSNEVIRSRSAILSENIQKWGHANVLVSNSDPSHFSSIEGFFDLVVVDAPCSGEGLFRKDPAAAMEWSDDNVSLCSQRQTRILHDIWPSVKEGGILIYCTCTYNAKENEDNLLSFSNDNSVTFLPLSVPEDWGIETIEKHGVIGYRFYPHRVKGEGFFLSVLRKNDGVKASKPGKGKKIQNASKKTGDAVQQWLSATYPLTVLQHNDIVFAVQASHVPFLEFLLQHLRFVYAGTTLASLAHDKLIPDHALAMSVDLNRDAFQSIELDRDRALQYLKRESIAVEGLEKGYSIVQYQGLPLGWVNVLPNRANNLYPQEWRIRMNTNGR